MIKRTVVITFFGIRLFFLVAMTGNVFAQATGELPIQVQELSPKENFQLAVREFNEGNYTNSELRLQEIIKQLPDHPDAHYNLGLVYFQSKKVGLALAHWRTALEISPSMTAAKRAITEFGQEQTQLSSILISNIRVLPLELWIILAAFLFFAFLWRYIERLGSVKRYLRGGEPPTSLNWISYLFLSMGLVFSFVSAVLIWDQFTVKATVISAKTELRSGPNPQSSALLDLREGSEIKVMMDQNEWIQIEEPRGLIGWLLKDQVMVTSRRWK